MLKINDIFNPLGNGADLNWSDVPKTASFTAENGRGYLIDTSSATPTTMYFR